MLVVIAFHANAHLVPGGFVGVDVFFVISGYLISNSIFKGLENGTFRSADLPIFTRDASNGFCRYILQ